MSWYIGQRIVAIRDHSQMRFKKGDEFVIQGLSRSKCPCRDIIIDIGLPSLSIISRCLRCDYTWRKGGACWFSERNFAPLDEWHEAEKAVKELLEPQKIEI